MQAMPKLNIHLFPWFIIHACLPKILSDLNAGILLPQWWRGSVTTADYTVLGPNPAEGYMTVLIINNTDNNSIYFTPTHLDYFLFVTKQKDRNEMFTASGH